MRNRRNGNSRKQFSYRIARIILLVIFTLVFIACLVLKVKTAESSLALILFTFVWFNIWNVIDLKEGIERKLDLRLKWTLTLKYILYTSLLDLKSLILKAKQYIPLGRILLALLTIAILWIIISPIIGPIGFKRVITLSDVISIFSSAILTFAIVYLMLRQLTLENPLPKVIKESEELVLDECALAGLEVINDSKHNP